jgi:predicted secreted protein
MSVSFAIAIYVVIWWTVLFAILPIGVRTQGEDGFVVPGTPASAPTSICSNCSAARRSETRKKQGCQALLQ